MTMFKRSCFAGVEGWKRTCPPRALVQRQARLRDDLLLWAGGAAGAALPFAKAFCICTIACRPVESI
jgi:hypothetical protein